LTQHGERSGEKPQDVDPADALEDSAILEHVFEESPLPIAIYDVHGRARRRNDAHVSFVSALGSVAGLGDFSALADERSRSAGHAQHFARAYAGTTLDYRFSCVRGEGPAKSTLHFQHLLMPVRAPDGSVATVVGIIADITEQEETLEERARFRERLFQLQKLESLGLLAGGIAHDFNNLLVAVLGNASHLLRTMDPQSPVRLQVVAIETAARRAAEIAQQMLLYAGKGRAELQDVDVVALVQEISALLHVSVSKRAMLELDCEADVPLVRGDGTQLRQVVMNLITNASEALGDGQGHIRVRAGRTSPDAEYLGHCFGNPDTDAQGFIYVEVRDDGSGMSPDVIARAFDPFFTTKIAGRGLGLSAVLGIIRRHRGGLFVESTPGQGTTMRVLLPSTGRPLTPIRPRAGPRPSLPSDLPVLLVDDDEGVREVTRALLEDIGCRVRVVESGEAALEFCRGHAAELALIVMDVTMPGVDGTSARELVRARHPDLPVLLMSGFGPPATGERDAFLAKPFTVEDLRDAVAAVVSTGTRSEHP
jgi:two-component system cell cycle sensor histidine kinase/response regulator CckA